MENNSADNKMIGMAFLIAGISLAVSLGMALGWVFAPAGAALIIVGLTYLSKPEGEE